LKKCGSIAFADIDGDNDQDVLITGLNNLGQYIAKQYRNITCVSTISAITISSCTTYTVPSGDETYSTTGSYTVSDTVPNYCGEDSIITIQLTIVPRYSQTEAVIVCNGDNYTFPDGDLITNITSQLIDTSYLQTMTFGCDSIIITTVTLATTYNQMETVIICRGDNYTFPDGDIATNIISQLTDTTNFLTNSVGCDSVIVTTITITPTYNQSDTVSVCNGDNYTFPDGDTITNITSQLTDTSHLQTMGPGCDSIIIITINVISIDNSVIQNETTLTANLFGANYQWLNCNDNNTELSGEIGQAFTADTSGNYAVMLTLNGCVDTSICTEISILGILENDFGISLTVYPNPTSGYLNIDLGKIYNDVNVKVQNIAGKTVLNKEVGTTNQFDVEILGSTGTYLVNIKTTSGESATIRVLKK